MVVDRGKGRLHYWVSALAKILLFPRIQVVLLFRLGHSAYLHGLSPLAYVLQAIGLFLSGAELHPAAQIGPGLCLVHSSGIVIGDRVQIGSHFICFHGVTVGDSGKGDGQPELGDWVTASAGAKILGKIVIGDRAVIGANAVVLCDVPIGGVAVGVPSRIAKVRAAV
jgi:serine O-acetyltransferase